MLEILDHRALVEGELFAELGVTFTHRIPRDRAHLHRRPGFGAPTAVQSAQREAGARQEWSPCASGAQRAALWHQPTWRERGHQRAPAPNRFRSRRSPSNAGLRATPPWVHTPSLVFNWELTTVRLGRRSRRAARRSRVSASSLPAAAQQHPRVASNLELISTRQAVPTALAVALLIHLAVLGQVNDLHHCAACKFT